MLLQRFVLLLCIMVIDIYGLTDEEKEMMKVLHDHCVGETGVDEGLIVEVNKGNFQPDPKLKCYLKCIMDSLGVLTDTGIDVEAMVAVVPDELKPLNVPAIRKCGNIVGADLCDTAYLLNKCYQVENPVHYHSI